MLIFKLKSSLLKHYYNCEQGKFSTTQVYLEHFQNVVAVVIESGGSIAGHEGVESIVIAEGGILVNEVTAGAFDNATVHFQFLNAEDAAVLQIGNDGKLPKSWILMDNQSTVNVFCNSNLLTNVRESAESMKIHCNEGVVTTNLIGELAG